MPKMTVRKIFKYPTHHINFCTEAALKCLEYRGYEEVQESE